MTREDDMMNEFWPWFFGSSALLWFGWLVGYITGYLAGHRKGFGARHP